MTTRTRSGKPFVGKILDWFRVGDVEPSPELMEAKEKVEQATAEWSEAMAALMLEHRKHRMRR